MTDKIVITGAAGLIGSLLSKELSSRFEIVGIDRAGAKTWDKGIIADVRETDRMRELVSGARAIVDLASTPGAEVPWREVLDNNMRASISVLQAALVAGVRCVVLASSNMVTGRYELEEPYRSILAGDYDGIDQSSLRRIRVTDPVRPDCPYAIGKSFTEQAALFFAENSDMSVYCLRIGTVNRDDRPTKPRHFSKLLTHRDLHRLVECCIDNPINGIGVYYGVSNNDWRIWDIDNALKEIGYAPMDNAEMLRSKK